MTGRVFEFPYGRKLRVAKWKYPYRKKPVLSIIDGNKEIKVASFNDEQAAEMFSELLRHLQKEARNESSNVIHTAEVVREDRIRQKDG